MRTTTTIPTEMKAASNREQSQTCLKLSELEQARVVLKVRSMLAVLIGLFYFAHVFMELSWDNASQYIIIPMMIVVCIVQAWYFIKM